MCAFSHLSSFRSNANLQPWHVFFSNRYVVVAEGSYRDELIAKIVFMCSRDKFAYLTDFAWYVCAYLMRGE